MEWKEWNAQTGAAVGLAVGGPIGMAVGASWGKKVQAKEEALERMEAIPEYDPMQLNFLDELKREKRSLESGFTTDFQVAKDLNKEMLAGGLSVAESVASTNPALALSMIDLSSKKFGTGINQALGTISTRSMGYTQSIGELINLVSQRKLDVETYKTAQQLGMAVDDLKTFKENVYQIVAKIPEMATAIAGMV